MKQTFGQELALWMRRRKLTVTSLSARMELSSRTTAHRILADQCTPAMAGRFLSRLEEVFRPEEKELAPLRAALDDMKYAPGETEFLDELDALMCLKPGAPFRLEWPFDEKQARSVTVSILDCAGRAVFDLVRALLKHPRVTVRHLIRKRGSSADHAGILPALALLPEPRYCLMTVPRETVLPTCSVFMQVRTADRDEWYLLLPDEKECSFIRFAQAPDPDRTDRLFRTAEPFFSANTMSNVVDYIDMLRDSFRREKNRPCHIVKMAPPVQAIPDDILFDAIQGLGNSENLDLMAGIDSLRMLAGRRFADYTTKTVRHSLLLSLPETGRFLRTGLLADHPEGFRALTPEERLRVFRILREMADRDCFSLRFTADRVMDHLSMEIYPGQGVLLFPSRTHYRTRAASVYREVFWPDPGIARLFTLYLEDRLVPRFCETESRSLEILDDLIADCGSL